MCSGAESPVMALRGFSRVVAQFYGEPVGNPQVAFASDNDKTVQDFFVHSMQPKCLCGDCAELADGSAEDVMSSGRTQVPAVCGLVAGFPCPDVARLTSDVRAKRQKVMTGGLADWFRFRERGSSLRCEAPDRGLDGEMCSAYLMMQEKAAAQCLTGLPRSGPRTSTTCCASTWTPSCSASLSSSHACGCQRSLGRSCMA